MVMVTERLDMQKLLKNQTGFTLLELLVALVVFFR
jgi:type II secretory pathway pseudopilin PulG